MQRDEGPVYGANSDICNGSVVNNASAWVNNLCGVRVNAPSNASVSLPVDNAVSLNITKTANTTGPVLPGQVIEYTIKVCNTGNLTLNNVNVTDNRTGSYTIASIPKGACNETEVLYTVQNSDICNGSVVNNASAWVNNLCGVRVNAPSNASVSIPTDTSVSLNITKTANTTGPVLPGQVIEYTIKVCNTGNLTLNNVNVTDNRTGSYTIASIPKGACNETKALYTCPEQRHL